MFVWKFGTKRSVQFLKEMKYGDWQKSIDFHEENLLELLLSKDITNINKELITTFTGTLIAHRQQTHQLIKNELYVCFFCDCFDETQYLLGEDILSPQIEIPTFDQLHEIYAWYKKSPYGKRVSYNSVDDVLRDVVTGSFKKIFYVKEFLEHGLILWESIFLSPRGREVHKELLNNAKISLEEKRTRISLLKRMNAPFFILEELTKNIEKLKKIVNCLERTCV